MIIDAVNFHKKKGYFWILFKTQKVNLFHLRKGLKERKKDTCDVNFAQIEWCDVADEDWNKGQNGKRSPWENNKTQGLQKWT